MPTRLPMLVIIAATLSVVGCGGGASKALSLSDLIARGDAICQRLNAEFSAAPPVRGPQDIARISPQRAAMERTVAAELSRLTPPSSITRDWQQIIAYRRMLAEDTIKLGEYAKANNIEGMRLVFYSSVSLQERLLATGKHDGFTNCSRLA
jgi:hypothetical protein